MKKRKKRNYGFFSIFLITFLFVTSLAFAASDSKLTAITKSTTEKKEIEDQNEKSEKVDTKFSSQKNETNKTTIKKFETSKSNAPVKPVESEQSKTVINKQVKPTEKNITNSSSSNTNEIFDSSSQRQTDKVKVDISNERKNTNVREKIFNDQSYYLQSEKNKITNSKSITSSKSNVSSNGSFDNDMISNYLEDHPHGASSHFISPRQKLKPQEIEIEDEDDNVEIIIYNNIEYRYYYGYYYRPWDGFYWRVWPPFGFRISWLPPYYYSFWWRDVEYYYSCNVYYVYVEKDNEYVVVRPPIGAIVETLPDYSEKLIVDGETYFVADGIQYKTVLVNEEVWFKVIKVIDDSKYDEIEFPVGSLVEVLPEEHEVIYIDDETYYISDNVQFKAVIVNDEIWFQVLKVG